MKKNCVAQWRVVQPSLLCYQRPGYSAPERHGHIFGMGAQLVDKEGDSLNPEVLTDPVSRWQNS